jgi:hypothetical protein
VIVTVDRMRGGWTTATLLALLGLGGCGRSGTHFFGSRDDAGDDSNVAATESDGLSATGAESSGGSSSTGEPNCVDSPELCTVQVTLRRAVDILFVVDNSGSMGGEQGTLAASFGSFIDVLESQQVGANYRIGITTTAGTGLLRATSCRSRLDEFLFSWQFGDLDERQRGCLENCDLDVIDVSEPWIEKGNGGTNLPPGIGVAEALKCVGPQWINELPGIPPVRLREFAEAFEVGERNIFSICDDDYGIAMTQIAAAIGDINERACVSGCVVDQLPDSPGLQPDCTLTETFTDAPDRAVPPCDLADQGWEFPAPDVHACYLALTDTEAETLTKVDDMSPQCVTVGSNLEYVIARRKDVPVPTGTSIEVRCQLTAPVGTSCDEK